MAKKDSRTNFKQDYLSINVSSLYSSIDRMSQNSGRVKTLFLPFVGIVLSTEFITVFGTTIEWFMSELHCIIFGTLIALCLVLCSLVFVWMDNFYLKFGRRYRQIYKQYCVPKDGLGSRQILDIGELQKTVSIKTQPAKNSLIYYFSIDLIVITTFFMTIFIVFHVC